MSLEESAKECWECNFSEYPIEKPGKVDLYLPLENGLTPYEIMYGIKDSDTIYANNLENFEN